MYDRRNIKEMFRFTKNRKETIIVGILLMVQILIYALSYPFVMQTIVDKAIPDEDIDLVIKLSIFLILVVIVRFFVDRYTEIKRKNCYYDNNVEIKDKIFKIIQNANISQLDKIQSGSLFEIVSRQAWEASHLFVWNFLGIVSVRLTSALVISAILLILNFKLGIIIILIFLVSYIILIPIYFKNMKIYKKLQSIMINLQGTINEYIESYSTTKTLKLEEINLLQIDTKLEECKKEILKANKIISMHDGLFSLLSFSSVISIVIVGGNELILGAGLSSTIMLMIDYADDINRHIQALLEHVHNFNNRFQCFLNILNISRMEQEKDEGTLSIDKVETIEFKEVTLNYDGENIVLDKINFKVNKPTKVAIVGKSGAGKTSLVNLLPRFYDIENGEILINGIDYKKYKLKELRKNISYVFQEPVIFEKSIIDNIKFGNKEDISIEDIKEMCKKIGLHEKISKLENGYNTIINTKTDLLSYGEKQLLSFTREILKNGDIVILDEATSNLDLEFEQKIMKATKEILKNKISFVIAHRLNTIENADLIIFIEDKKIVEMGTHEQLMKKCGYYYKLWKTGKIEIKRESVTI